MTGAGRLGCGAGARIAAVGGVRRLSGRDRRRQRGVGRLRRRPLQGDERHAATLPLFPGQGGGDSRRRQLTGADMIVSGVLVVPFRPC